MSWNCEHIEARLSDYLDGLLPADEQRQFRAHAESCAGCGRLVQQVGGFVSQLRGLEQVEEPPRLVYKILEETVRPRKAPSKWKILDWLQPVVQSRFALGTVAMLLVMTVVLQASGVTMAQLRDIDWHPRSLMREANRQSHLMYARSVKFVNDLRVVYEIQTRLQSPQEQVPPVEEPQRAPGSTEKEPSKRDREMNRADEWKSIPVTLAMAAPGRSF